MIGHFKNNAIPDSREETSHTLARQRKMPSMAGFDLEVTGYDEAPPARAIR